MTLNDIANIVATGKNETIEFKSSFNDEVIGTLVAFANTKGGKVIIGVDNNGNPTPNFKIGNETIQNWVNEIKNKTQPSIIPDFELLKLQGKVIVVCSVSEFPVKPVSFKDRFLKRVNNSNHTLNAIEIVNLSLQSLQLSWDSYPAHGISFNDLDLTKIEKFIAKVNATGRFKLEGLVVDCLHKLRLVNNGVVTNAANLLFSKSNLPYNIHCGRFKTESLIIDDKMFNSTLFRCC
jgi:ATP-dependent DNA helicase RecG